MTRRDLLRMLAAGVALTGCEASPDPLVIPQAAAQESDARLEARPRKAGGGGKPGMLPIGLGGARDGVIYVPESYRDDTPAPLALMLHGAGGGGQRVVENYRARADESHVILVAPESRATTWDVIRGRFGEDVRFIDDVLARIFARYAIDPAHVAIGGFSDGATYALSLGITNGDLFTHILAFSPGFAVPAAQHGKPRIFVSHGTEDTILPIDRCSRRIVPRLKHAGYDVTYEEFHGPHRVPEPIAREAFAWFTK